MYDKDKIRIMSKLAVYDKNDFERDAKANHYFRHDYIYKHNMRMRFFLGIGLVILLFFYVMHLLAIEGADLFTLDFEVEIMRLLFYALVIMFAYSFIGAIIYTRQFIISERRVNAYFTLMRQLDGGEATDKDVEAMQNKPKVRKKRVKAEEADESDFEEHVPYRRYERATLEYRRRGNLNNELQEDDDDK